MPSRPPLIFALRGSEDYAARVAQHVGGALAPHEEREFEDGEHKCRPLVPVRGREVVVIHGLYGEPGQSANDKLCRLLFFCAALKDAGARQVQVVAPYLCYARKERRTEAQDPIISRYVAAMIESCGVDALLTLEVHNTAAFDNAFRIPTRNVEGASLFAEYFAAQLDETPVVAVSPDAGGAKRAEQFRQALEARLARPVASAYLEKFRSNDRLWGGRLVGEVNGATAIIVDDLISTGSTLLRAAEACHAAGASRVFAAAVHGLFTGDSALLDSPLLEQLVISDSVPPLRVDAARAGRLTVLDSSASVAALLAEEFDLPLAGTRT